MKTSPFFRTIIALLFVYSAAAIGSLPPNQVLARGVIVSEASEAYSSEELAQMLAPIALYPDELLSQVLMASTYPIEVIEADRWIKNNSDLEGNALDEALLARDWDPSVKGLCRFPSVLALMSERIAETTSIGNAFLAREEEVLDMIQELRAAAHARGNLATTTEQKVIVEKEKIIIEPANPRVVYVPYYDPLYVYGPWRYPAYPPYYWGPAPRVSIGVGISYWPGFYFGFSYNPWCRIDWHSRYIYVNVHKRPKYVRHDRWISSSGRWSHAPLHRRGVLYRDKTTARRYGSHPGQPARFRHDAGVLAGQRLQPSAQGPAGIQTDARRRPVAQPLGHGLPGIRSDAPQRPKIQSHNQRRPGMQPRVQGLPGMRFDRTQQPGIGNSFPERREIQPGAGSLSGAGPDRRIRQQSPGEIPVREWAERRPGLQSRENNSNRFQNSGRQRPSGPGANFSRQGSSPFQRGGGAR